MATAKCVFCGKEQEDHSGVYLIKNDGSVNYYSSGKCMKNHLRLRRDRRKVRWTEAFHITRQKKVLKQEEAEKRAKEEKAMKEVKKADKKTNSKKK
jgi:large subunit ribosomal protein L24e